jgi:hypothetical protein
MNRRASRPRSYSVMKDLSNPVWIKLKGALFLLLGLAAAGLLWLEQATLKSALLLALVIWCFCRAYYFAFYVIEHYVDPGFKFSGLGAFLVYLLRGKK